MLHLSAAILDKSSGKSTRLYAKNGKDANVCIACLSDKQEQASLDLYINCTQNVTFSVQGPSEIHLSGYFEPKGDDMDDDMFYGQEGAEGEDDEDEDDDDEDEEEEVKPKHGKAKAIDDNLKMAQMNSQKNAANVASVKGVINMAESDSDIEDDLGEDDEDLEDLDDMDLDAEESEESDEPAIPV